MIGIPEHEQAEKTSLSFCVHQNAGTMLKSAEKLFARNLAATGEVRNVSGIFEINKISHATEMCLHASRPGL